MGYEDPAPYSESPITRYPSPVPRPLSPVWRFDLALSEHSAEDAFPCDELWSRSLAAFSQRMAVQVRTSGGEFGAWQSTLTHTSAHSLTLRAVLGDAPLGLRDRQRFDRLVELATRSLGETGENLDLMFESKDRLRDERRRFAESVQATWRGSPSDHERDAWPPDAERAALERGEDWWRTLRQEFSRFVVRPTTLSLSVRSAALREGRFDRFLVPTAQYRVFPGYRVQLTAGERALVHQFRAGIEYWSLTVTWRQRSAHVFDGGVVGVSYAVSEHSVLGLGAVLDAQGRPRAEWTFQVDW